LVLSMVFRSVGVLAILTVSVLSGPGVVGDAPLTERQQQGPTTTLWRTSYSERYPGCVPSVLWPADEQPVAVVTRTPDGRIDRVALDADQRLVRALPAAAETIGACR
jgi:hypothetical protein